MTAVTPVTARSASGKNGGGGGSSGVLRSNSGLDDTASSSSSSVHDLVPAGLVKPGRDGLPIVKAKYTKVGESFRKNVPHEMQCSMFCGGRRCKYESGDPWQDDQMALKGIYSHWITDNLLAMARPNTGLIAKTGLLDQFKKHGIKSVINLQTPGEHASCGPRLEESGFTYEPDDFMKHDVFFYNFAWKDFREAPMPTVLDMVKVLSFALSEGKVAVHCHAGLGRTGVLLACYLVYHLRVRANDALRYVRLKRPGAVQTRRQIDCVKEFEAYFLPQCLIFSNRPPGDADRRTGRFSVEQHLKRQKYVLHGFEARTLKYIPKLVFKICERLLRVCQAGPSYVPDAGGDGNGNNFTKHFLAYRFDHKAGGKLLNFKEEDSSIVDAPTPSNSDSMNVTRRSSRSMLLSTDDESSAYPTPASYSRPGSETNSYIQSCSSALSGVDDKRLDEILADGIRNQTLQENRVTLELASRMDLQRVARDEQLPKASAEDVYRALMQPHGEILRAEGDGSWASGSTLAFKQYRVDLNFKMSAWDRVDTETDLFVLAGLLLEWLEHLKSPVLDKDGITYVVIYCDNIDAALRKLPNHVCYILEYLVRFVARLQPLARAQSEDLLRRLMASLTHQSIVLNDVVHPTGKPFPRLRGGTADSTLKFLTKLLDAIMAQQQQQQQQLVVGSNGGGRMGDTMNSYRLRSQMTRDSSMFNSLDASATSSVMINNSATSFFSPKSSTASSKGVDGAAAETMEVPANIYVDAQVHSNSTNNSSATTSGTSRPPLRRGSSSSSMPSQRSQDAKSTDNEDGNNSEEHEVEELKKLHEELDY